MNTIVLALTRADIPRARSVATACNGTADVLVVEPLHLPWRNDVCMGVIVEGGDTYLDQRFISALGISDPEVALVAESAYAKLEKHAVELRGKHAREVLHDHPVVVIGDHVKPGVLRVALEAIRARGAKRVFLAASPDAELDARTRELVDDVVDLPIGTSDAAA